MLTATPHSGKPEEFQSLLGLLKPDYEALDLPNSTQQQRRDLAKHFIQRKRADVEKWLGEDTPFPDRDPFELAYSLSPRYVAFFEGILAFARRLVAPDPSGKRAKKRVQYWTALALLRGVMSSPAAGVKMLNTRLAGLATATGDDAAPVEGADALPDTEASLLNPVADQEYPAEGDSTPTQIVEQNDWTDHQRRQLRQFAEQLEALSGPNHDQKLASLATIVAEWLEQGFSPVIFCRYIPTANYVGQHLQSLLARKFPKLCLRVVTSEDPDDVRKQRIKEMHSSPQRVLVATDCLSEGINLQDLFTAVLHYDLPWNPNRLEQREGRVDRFGQTAKVVKACLLYGADNPIDGIVLDVLLRKVREIKRATGINVPFPEDSQSIIDTITQALLLNPDRKISTRQVAQQPLLFDFHELPEAERAKARVTRKVDEAADREKFSRSIFAQNAIQAQEIEQDLRGVNEAIGDPKAVQEFVITALLNLFGVQVTADAHGEGYTVITANLPPQLQDILPEGHAVKVSFASPTPKGYHYLGRNNRFVEQLCQVVMANTLARVNKRAARAAVVRTKQVVIKSTLLLFRCRNVIEQGKGGHQIVAEEMLLWGWRGTPNNREFIDHAAAKSLLASARASSDLSPQSRASFLDNELQLLASLDAEFTAVAEEQSKRLVVAHERFSALMDRQRYQVVYPVLPMDLLGIYVLLPEVAG